MWRLYVTTMACVRLLLLARWLIRTRRARREAYGRELRMVVRELFEQAAYDEDIKEDHQLARYGML